MKNLPTQSSLFILAAAMIQMSGCAPLTPNLDDSFGDSLRTLMFYQTINPSASMNTASPQLDGRAAMEVTDRYYKSYSAPAPQQNVFTIGVGGGTQ